MLQNGESIHHYVVVSPKGNGSFGHVFEVQDTNANETLALKLLTDLSGDNDTRFRAENDHLHTLAAHSNIIDPKTRVLDIGGKTFYCMELADASTQQHITTNPPANGEALLLFKEICEGMKHAHEKRIVHRDLHLGNVLLMVSSTGALSPRLTDFGRAKDFNAATISYVPALVWGAVSIWSPEIFFLIWEDAEIDNYVRSDIYALGIMLHDLLAPDPVLYRVGLINSIATYLSHNNVVGNGGIQIDATVDIATRQQHHRDWLAAYDRSNQNNLNVSLRQPDATLQLEVNRIILKCCATDYNDRYMTVDELLKDVSAIC